MEFRIADTFLDALARLPAQEQKAVKVSAMDLQMNPVSTGLQMHRIDNSKDRNFWSVRVGRDIRIIVHKTAASMLLAYVDHHDKAYAWAERRRIEAHPKTGAVQIVEVRESFDDGHYQGAMMSQVAPISGAAIKIPPPACFASLTENQLLSVGIPPDWVEDLHRADEDGFLALADHLPAEASEALLEYVSTGVLKVPKPIAVEHAFTHPDALRRFRTVENAQELEQALDFPWDKWQVFLHPSQRTIIEQDFSGPARVAGSAGTGKTVVALHRAARSARGAPAARVLLTTFSRPLANLLERKLAILCASEADVRSRITVTPFHGVAQQLYELRFGRRPYTASDDMVESLLTKAAADQGADDISPRFLMSEWTNVADPWQVQDEQQYAAVPRLGRKNRMGAQLRGRLWEVFDAVKASLAKTGASTWPQVLSELTAHYEKMQDKPFTHIVVDEAQDLGIAELRFLSSIVPNTPNALFFAGDLGQRIFQQPFSWLGLGLDVRGRSETLKVNYRTSQQIREMADHLLPPLLRDVDGIEEIHTGTISELNGPDPVVMKFPDSGQEVVAVGKWLDQMLQKGIAPAEVGVFVRSYELLDRARHAVEAAKQTAFVLSDRVEDSGGRVSVGIMHLAKGLEFKAVAVMACDDNVLPLQARINSVADEVELDDVYETERQLLYVACTRARDELLVTCVAPGSEFLNDLNAG